TQGLSGAIFVARHYGQHRAQRFPTHQARAADSVRWPHMAADRRCGRKRLLGCQEEVGRRTAAARHDDRSGSTSSHHALARRAGVGMICEWACLMCSDKPNGFRTLPSATGGIARLACARLRAAGQDGAGGLAKAGLKAEFLDDPTRRLDVTTQIKVLNLAAAELDDQLLGFHLARNFELGQIGLLYYVMASSEQLSDALRNAGRYSGIVNEGVRLHFTVDEAATISLDYVGVDRRSDRHQADFWLVTLMRICRQVTETRLAPLRLKVRHSSAGPTEEFKSFFGHDMEFEQDADAIIFSAQTASLPLIGRDVYLN